MARPRLSSFPRRPLLVALLLAAAGLVLVAPVFMLAMAPALALFAMFAHRIMPGEELIVRLRSRYVARGRVRALPVGRVYDVMVVRRAGHLIASALAMRPPPERLPVAS